eukprot:scaffold46214_cov60-Attheya_sp.AAC.3
MDDHDDDDDDDDDDDEEEDPHTQNRGWSTRVNLRASTSRDILVSSDSTKSLHETKVNLDYSSAFAFQDMLAAAVHPTSTTTSSHRHDYCDNNIEVNYLSNHNLKEDPTNQDTRNTNNAMEESSLAHTPLLSEEEGGGIEIVATRSTTRNNDDDVDENDHVHEPENVQDNDSLEDQTDTMATKESKEHPFDDTTGTKQYKSRRTTRQDSFHKSDNSSEKSNESESESSSVMEEVEQQESRILEKKEEDSVAESYNYEYGENQYLQESSVASFTTMTGSHAFLERNKTPISLPTFKPATGCTNASDFVVRCIAARLRGGVAVIKHGRSRWCRSRMRLLLLHTDGRTLTWTPAEGEPNTNKKTKTTTKRRHHAATPLDLATCSEVRHAWSPDPKCHGFTGTPILRSKCDAANAHKSFALVFPKRTVDITAVTADQCKVLMEGLSALIYRLQIAEMERTRLKLDEDHISTTLTGSSFTPSPIRTGSRRDM